jgi:hypothetical protein
MAPKFSLAFFIFVLFVTAGYSQTLPFTVHLTPVAVSGMPGVQSFASAHYGGKWLIVGGRLDGLHKPSGPGMGGSAFPVSHNNNELIVVDPATQQKWSASLTSFPADIREQLSSTNTQYIQQGDYLYVMGGYGFKAADNDHRTFDKIAALHVPAIMTAIMNGTPFSQHIRQITDARFRITGGQLRKVYDTYYLVGGNNFNGAYTRMATSGRFTQEYMSQIVKFKIIDDGINFSIRHLATIKDSINLHRRDYNLVPQILPNGQQGLTAFSGVFQPTADLPYLNCVNIDSTGHAPNNAFAQYYNHYHCANLPIYATSNSAMYSIFFGGIAQYYDNNGTLVQDNNVPFVKTIACVKRDASGVMTEYKLPAEMPEYLGAGSEFFPVETVPQYPNNVVKYDSLINDTTLVGYIFGGIKSPAMNIFTSNPSGANGSSAANNIFAVKVIKRSSTRAVLTSSANVFQLQLYPNPSSGSVDLLFNLKERSTVSVRIMNAAGQIVLQEPGIQHEAGQHTMRLTSASKLVPGAYQVLVEAGKSRVIQKLIIK